MKVARKENMLPTTDNNSYDRMQKVWYGQASNKFKYDQVQLIAHVG